MFFNLGKLGVFHSLKQRSTQAAYMCFS